MAVTMKNAIFWDVTSLGSCENQCFRRTLMMEMIRYSISQFLQEPHSAKKITILYIHKPCDVTVFLWVGL
jgi:hypothetical protein